MLKERHYTATVFIFHEDKVLLIFHKKMQKWLPPGGHVEPGELPSEAAIREAKEETGFDIEFIRQENLWVAKKPNCQSLARPYMCLLEEIPQMHDSPSHQHIDFIYIARPIGGSLQPNLQETTDIRWFTEEQISLLQTDVEIFEECTQLIHQFFESKNSLTTRR